MTRSISSMVAALLLLAMATASAVDTDTDTDTQKIVLGDNGFQPDTLTIEADQRVKITVANQTKLPAEFEGKDFPTEKVIPAGTTLPVYLGPLEAGTYHFFNEFAPSVTGTLTVE